MGAVWPSVCRNEMSGQRLEVRRGVFIPQVKIEPFRSTSEVPTQIPGLPTYEENTVHNRSEVRVCKSVSELLTNVGTSDGHHFRRTSGLPTGTVNQTANTAEAGTPGLGQVSVGTPGERRDFRRAQTASSQKNHRCWDCWLGSGLLTVGTSDTRRDFRLSGVPTHVGTSDVHSHRAGCD